MESLVYNEFTSHTRFFVSRYGAVEFKSSRFAGCESNRLGFAAIQRFCFCSELRKGQIVRDLTHVFERNGNLVSFVYDNIGRFKGKAFA
jgi:hypothetical protein